MLFHGLPYGKGIENVKDITRKYESHHVCLLSLSTRATFSLGRSLSLSAPQGIRGTEENRKQDRSRCPAALLRLKLSKTISLPVQDQFAYKLHRLNQSSLSSWNAA